MARIHDIPFYLYPMDKLPDVASGFSQMERSKNGAERYIQLWGNFLYFLYKGGAMKYIVIAFLAVFITGTGGSCSDSPYAQYDEYNDDSGYEDTSTKDEKMGDQSQLFPENGEITQELIDKEEEWLEKKIREINETPVEEFGSLILQQKERAYYAHRLDLLHEDPEAYFATKKKK